MLEKQRVAWTVIGNSNFEQGVFDKAEAAYARAQAVMPPNDPERAGDRRSARRVDLQAGRAEENRPATAPAPSTISCASRLWRPPRRCAPTPISTRRRCSSPRSSGIAPSPVLEGFRRNFPQSPLQADVTRKLAVAYSESNQPAQAAVEFETNCAVARRRRPTCSAKRPCRRRICTTRRAIPRSRAPCSRPSSSISRSR